MTYDSTMLQVFANDYPTAMDAHNRMPDDQIALCEYYWNMALEAAANDTAASMNKTMSVMMPLMTGFFTLTFPSAIGLYWIMSSVMQIVTQYLLNIYFDKREDDFVVTVPEKNRKNSKKRK